MGFSRQAYWSGLPLSPQRDLPDPGIQPVSCISCITNRLFTTKPSGEAHCALKACSFCCIPWHKHSQRSSKEVDFSSLSPARGKEHPVDLTGDAISLKTSPSHLLSDPCVLTEILFLDSRPSKSFSSLEMFSWNQNSLDRLSAASRRKPNPQSASQHPYHNFQLLSIAHGSLFEVFLPNHSPNSKAFSFF